MNENENVCTPVEKNTGLRGIEVASSKICDVRGKEGKLIYRGYSIEGLAEKASFEETCFLLLYERLPQKKELTDFDQSLKSKRRVPENLFPLLKSLPPDMNPMDVLQMATPLLIQTDANAGKEGMENTLYSAENLIAGLPTITAAWDRIRNSKEPIAPDNSLSHAANFLQGIAFGSNSLEATGSGLLFIPICGRGVFSSFKLQHSLSQFAHPSNNDIT